MLKKFLSVLFSLFMLGILITAGYFNQTFLWDQLTKINGVYWVWRGDRAYKNMETQQAISFYNKALLLYPSHYGAWHNLGNIYVAYEDYNSALYAYSQAINYNPRMVIARINYGIVSSTMLGDFDSAIDQYNIAILTKRKVITIPLIYSNRLSAKNNRAIAYYNKGVAYRLKSLYSNANWEVQRKNLARAIEAYQQSIEINPDSYDTQYNLGVAYFESGDYDRAGVAYCKAINLSPMSYEAHYNLAVLLRKLGYYNESYEEIEKALTLISAMDESSSIQQYVATILNDILRDIHRESMAKTVVLEKSEKLKDAKMDEAVLKLKSYEAMVDVANGSATKIIVPSDLQGLVTAGTVLKETLKKDE